jgi:S-formylglutathione hydrolase FrmB
MLAQSRLAIALVLLLTTTTIARQPAVRPAGEVVIQSLTIEALKGNLLGDPAERNVAVYLPPTYKTSPTRRYPTVYLLHGYLSNLQAFGAREGIPGYQGMRWRR